ncbi:MAG: transglutaminase-like domain-containing protein [Rubripirellula sp.]
MNVSKILATLCAAVILVGCDIPPRPPLEPVDAESQRNASVSISEQATETLETPSDSFEDRWETWDAYFVGNKRVGYSHVLATSVDQSTNSDVQYELEDRIFLRQGRARILQQLKQTSTESYDGRLLSFQSTLRVGPHATQFNGSLNGSDFQIEIARGNARTVRRVPWQSTFRGLVAVEQSLRAKPMVSKGEKRTLKMLLPGSYQLVTARLLCMGKAVVPLIDGSMQALTEVTSQIELSEEEKSFSSIWTNEAGEIVRTFSPELHLLGYRTDAETALNFAGNELDVAAVSVVGKLERSEEAKRLALKIEPALAVEQSDQAFTFPAAPGQFVRPLDDGTFQILVSRKVEQVSKGFVSADLVLLDEDSKPNHFIDSNATLVRRFADAAVGSSEMTDEEIAIEMTKTANKLIGEKDTTGLSRASEIARDGVGDSTENAILLAALLRARQIPTRVVFGLKYSDGQPNKFVYHAWNIVWIKDHWMQLDATIGGQPPADRLILAESNLNGTTGSDAMVAYLDMVRRIKITILGAQYK